jgi:hypothetical protein
MKTIRMEIKRLLDRWDPLSLKGLPGFHSEYNDFVGPLSVLVRKRAAPSEIAQHLHRLLTETWKMPADQPGCYKLAEKIHRTGAFLDVPPAQ